MAAKEPLRRLARAAAHLAPSGAGEVSREQSADPAWRPSTGYHVPAEAIVRQAELTPRHCEFFAEQGFLVFPAWLPEQMCANLKRDMDAHMQLRDSAGMSPELDHPMEGPQPPLLVSYPTDGLGGLTTYPPTMECLRTLMDGNNFAMHHVHGSRMDAGTAASNWHQVSIPKPDRYLPTELTPRTTCTPDAFAQDYEQYPQTDRELRMIHAFNCARPRCCSCVCLGC